MKILIINGPNLNMLGKREKGIYGNMTLEEINQLIAKEFTSSDVNIDYFQSNEEGKLITEIQLSEEAYDGVIINPGAYSHYSIAILDAIRSIAIPVIEVHLSNIHSREEYRRKTVTGEGCLGIVSGFGYYGYIMAVNALINTLINIRGGDKHV